MAVVDLHPDIIAAINRTSRTGVGRRFDRMARRKYGISGSRLAAKQTAGESGGRMGAVSPAGAHGATQFMPATRQEMIRRFGIDPWRSPKEAIQALERYDLEHGVAGYNPGMPTYEKYVLGTKVSPGNFRALQRGTGGGGAGGGTPGFPGLTVAGPTSHTVTLGTQTVPGQSFAPERQALRDQLFLGPGGLTMKKLLAYKMQLNSLQDVPATTRPGDLRVTKQGGGRVRIPGVAGRAGSGAVATGRLGRVSVAPGADRPGVRTNPAVVQFVRRVAGEYGGPLTIGTGSNHNRMTVNGNVSDHWSGNAADVPLTGRALIRAGQDALIAAGMSPRQARRTNGGLFNVGGWQIIFNTHEGGDHTNHLHVGRRTR